MPQSKEKVDYVLVKETPYSRYWRPLGPWGLKPATEASTGARQGKKKRGRPFKNKEEKVKDMTPVFNN